MQITARVKLTESLTHTECARPNSGTHCSWHSGTICCCSGTADPFFVVLGHRSGRRQGQKKGCTFLPMRTKLPGPSNIDQDTPARQRTQSGSCEWKRDELQPQLWWHKLRSCCATSQWSIKSRKFSGDSSMFLSELLHQSKLLEAGVHPKSKLHPKASKKARKPCSVKNQSKA